MLGAQIPAAMAANLGGAEWVALFWATAQAYETKTALDGLSDNEWEWSDTFNLLSLLGLAAPSGGAAKGLTTMRASQALSKGDDTANAQRGMNQVLRDSSRTRVNLKGKCFVAGTEVLTTEGEKDIEDIEVGDWVIADDPTTPGEIEARQVLDTFVRKTDELIDLYVDGEVISTTGEHPFWVPDKGWVEAKDLQVGSLLQTEDGKIIDIDGIERREGEFEVYNFKVEGFHTYFVSDLEVLVHNACGFGEAANLPDLNGLSGDQVRQILKDGGFQPSGSTPSAKGWQKFKHPDKSHIDINWHTGRIVRTEAPKYDPTTGARTNKAQRIDFEGNQIPRHIEHKDHPPEIFLP